MLKSIGEKIETYKLYCNMTNLVPIARRYFIIGYFDGALTILGLITGAHLSGKATPEVILSAGVATAIALGISSGWGAYEAERVEQAAMKLERDRAMLKSVGGIVERAHNFAIIVSSMVHALSPIVASLIPLVFYVFLPIDEAFPLSIAAGLIQLFVVGAFMGKVSKKNVLASGIRLALAGIVTLLVVLLLSPSRIM
ncbi:MAG: hypothetical protein DSY33_06250 [Archaeoglobus sp.]|nr:MAG: hypothetical protein DSY33_06250 [Archaeoglobus sp.]